MAEEKNMANKDFVEGEAKEVVKQPKEKLHVKVGKGLKKLVTSKPAKIIGRTLVVAGSALGTVAFLKSGTDKNYEALDMLDVTPQFPDTTMPEIQTETIDETE